MPLTWLGSCDLVVGGIKQNRIVLINSLYCIQELAATIHEGGIVVAMEGKRLRL